jgi:hypothetical protein
VGATRESVNRQLQAWRRQGILELGRAKIHIKNATQLADASEPEEPPQGTAPN